MSYEFLKPGNSVNFNTKTNVLKTEYSGVITGVMKFGLFIEFESIFTGLLHFSAMDSNFYQQFKNKKPGISAWFAVMEGSLNPFFPSKVNQWANEECN